MMFDTLYCQQFRLLRIEFIGLPDSKDKIDMTEISSAPQRILIADDVPSNLVLLEALISSEGVEVLKATSGQEAIDILSKVDVSLVLLDVIMPDIDGYEVAEVIRSTPRTKYVPIIFVTGSDKTDDNILKSYQSGVVDVLYKPLQPAVIIAKVRVFLELDQQRRLIKQQSEELETALKRLQHYAQHDQLTQLFNRDQITSILKRLMASSRRTKKQIGLFFLDLDHFKNVNDSLGHDIGDLLLKGAADRIKNAVRESDFVARLGGDEFSVILSNLDHPASASQVAQKILDALALPHHINGHEILISCSIGIALHDGKSDSTTDLLKSADSAMYQAKRKGRNQFAYFSPELEQQAIKKMDISRGLHDAMENNELSIHYQPQIAAATGEMIGFEALLRWEKDGNWISPGEFIPIAEESGLIPKLGAWVLLHSCLDLKKWQDDGIIGESIKVAVNISNRQIQASNFLTVVKNVLQESKISPTCVEFELTESSVMDDPESTISTFNEIHKLGIEISVDDFGTGYSSLSYLRQLPLDCIQIDKSFTQDIGLDKNDEAIVKAIIALSHNLELKVVAEGVETEQQAAFLRKHRCDILQGYLFSRPIPQQDVAEFVTSFKPCL